MKLGKIENRRLCFAIILGIALSVIFEFGWFLENRGQVPFGSFLTYLLLIILAAAFSFLSYLLLGIKIKAPKEKAKVSKKQTIRFFALVSISMLIIWAVWFLAAYPGFFAYDAPWQWQMYADNAITEHHPVLHTLIIGKLLSLSQAMFGNVYRGVAAYTVLQIFCTVLSFSYALTYLYKKNASKVLLAISYVWFAFAPTIVINGLATTKDSVFAMGMVVFFVLSYQMLEEGEEFFKSIFKMIAWVLIAILCAIMRNNMIYVIIPFVILLLFVNRKHFIKYSIMALAAVLIYVLYSQVLVRAVTVSRLDTEEFLSIPIQQVSWTYMNNREILTEEEISLIENSFSENAFDYYNPRISDGVKFEFDIESYKEDSSEFINLWLNLLKKNPQGYINAFLINNSGLWYPWPTYVTFTSGDIAYGICRSYNPIINHSHIPVLEKYLSLFEYSEMVCENNITKWIFAPGTWFILFLVAFSFALYKRKRMSYFYLFIFLFWATFLLGPVALQRYVSFIFYMVPLLLWTIYENAKEHV